MPRLAKPNAKRLTGKFPQSDRAKAVKGAMRSVTHKPYKRPNRHDQEVEETKQALHEVEEQTGDWSRSR